MGKESKIQWCDATFNPWRGCTKVSPACDHCYAETMSKRNQAVLGVWGKYGSRVIASGAMWKEPLRWNREAEALGVRKKVFCASLADVFESRDTMPENSWSAVAQARIRLFQLIDSTKNLDWLLLTKRPENIASILREEISLGTYGEDWNFADHMPNVWLGTTVENQKYADIRIPELLKVNAAVRFLSIEPMLGEVDVSPYLYCHGCGYSAKDKGIQLDHHLCKNPSALIDWIILGSESGSNRRPMNLEWAESVVDQCKAAGVPVFVKQLEINGKVTGDIEQFPRELQVREFPNNEVKI